MAAAHSVGRAAGERAAGLGDGEQLLDCYPACAVVPKDVNGGPRPATRWVFTLLGYQYRVKPVPMGT